MFSKKPDITIEKIEHVGIHYPYHPRLEKTIIEYFKDREKNIYSPPKQNYEENNNKSRFLSSLDLLSKVISVISGLAIIVFVLLLWRGHTTIGTVQVSSLLTIISFTLIGGIFSIGGVQMFAINANLRKSQNTVNKFLTSLSTCPFLNIHQDSQNPNLKNYEPGNPQFCAKCPLGIDTTGNVKGGLIHVCKVYIEEHQKWKLKDSRKID